MSRMQTYGTRAQQGAIARSQLHHGVVAVVCYPDVISVENDTLGADADVHASYKGVIARPQYGHGVSDKIWYPDVTAIKGKVLRPLRTKNAKSRAVVRSQLGHGAI